MPALLVGNGEISNKFSPQKADFALRQVDIVPGQIAYDLLFTAVMDKQGIAHMDQHIIAVCATPWRKLAQLLTVICAGLSGIGQDALYCLKRADVEPHHMLFARFKHFCIFAAAIVFRRKIDCRGLIKQIGHRKLSLYLFFIVCQALHRPVSGVFFNKSWDCKKCSMTVGATFLPCFLTFRASSLISMPGCLINSTSIDTASASVG